MTDECGFDDGYERGRESLLREFDADEIRGELRRRGLGEPSVAPSENEVRTVTFDFAQRIAKLFEYESTVVVEAKGESTVVRIADEDWDYEYTISVRKSA